MTASETALALSREQAEFYASAPEMWSRDYVRDACHDALTAHDLADRIAVLEAELKYERDRADVHAQSLRDAAQQLAAKGEEIARLRVMTSMTMGVGDGSGKLFIHGDHDSISAVRKHFREAEEAIRVRDEWRAHANEWRSARDAQARRAEKAIAERDAAEAARDEAVRAERERCAQTAGAWPKDGESLLPHEMLALRFLAKVGTDCVGVIDDENKMAAALVFGDLKRRGLVIAEITSDGPVYRLTPAGRETDQRGALPAPPEGGDA